MSDAVKQWNKPEAERPWMPEGYMKPTTEEKMLKWDDVSELLRGALNYWIATTTADGRPHVRPVWGAWSKDILYFDGSPATGWGRNIQRDPRISVQVEAGDIAIIIEGVIVTIAQADDDELVTRLLGEYNAKYLARYNYDATDASAGWRKTGMFSLHPRKIFAWDVTEFGTSPTKWTFDSTAREAK